MATPFVEKTYRNNLCIFMKDTCYLNHNMSSCHTRNRNIKYRGCGHFSVTTYGPLLP